MNDKPLRVLLVDDEKSLRKPLAEFLQTKYGYCVDDAANGNEALALIDAAVENYDVVVTDEVLDEGPSGIELLRLIKNRDLDTEVILFTGWGLSSGVEALRAGAYRYFAKPFDKEELALTIQFAAEQTRSRLESRFVLAMFRLSQAINASLNLSEIFEQTCKSIVEIFGVDHSGLVKFSPDQSAGTAVAHYPLQDTIDPLGTTIPVRGVIAEERLVFQREILNISNVAQDDALGSVRDILMKHGIRSILVVPIVVHERVVASFSLDSIKQERRFSNREIELCKALAEQVAIALNNERLYATERALRQTLIAINSEWDRTALLDMIVQQSAKLLQANNGILQEYSPERGELTTRANYRLPEHVGKSIKLGEGAGGYLVQSARDFLIIADYHNSPYCAPVFAHEKRIGAVLGVPLKWRSETLGALFVNDDVGRKFTEDDANVLRIFADQAATAMKNSELLARDHKKVELLQKLSLATQDIMSGISTRSLDNTLSLIARHATDILNGEVCGVFLVKRKGFLSLEASYGHREGGFQKGREFEIKSETGSGLTGHIAYEGRVFNEFGKKLMKHAAWGRSDSSYAPSGQFNSLLGIPLKRQDERGEELVGLLRIGNKKDNKGDTSDRFGFSDEDIEILEIFAKTVVIAINSARQIERLDKGHKAAEIIARLSALGSRNEALTSVVSGTKEALECDAVTLFVYDQANDDLEHPPTMIGVRHQDRATLHGHVLRDSIVYLMLDRDDLYVAEDVFEDMIFHGRRFAQDEDIKSCIAIPLKSSGQKVGVMFINYRQPHTFTLEELKRVELFANQAAVAIRNVQLYDQTEHRASALEAIYESGNAISGLLTLSETLQRVVNEASKIFSQNDGGDKCGSHLVLLKEAKFELAATNTPEFEDALRKAVAQIDLNSPSERIGLVGRAVIERRTQNAREAAKNNDFIPYGPHILSKLSSPVIAGDQVIGAISVESGHPNAFTREDEHTLESLAAQAAVAIQNARQYDELKKTKGLIGARTALAWIGMVSSAWRHTVEKHAITIRDQIELLKRDLATSPKLDSASERLDMIERLANQIMEKPTTPPLSSDEGASSVNINQLLHERTRRLWDQLPYNATRLSRDLRLSGTATTRASPEWLRRAFDILVDNAVEATEGRPERRITVFSQQRDQWAEIGVTDNGTGMTEETRFKLFNECIEKPQGSSGLGLGALIAQLIAQTYGGEIRVDSTGPQGTTIIFSMPLEEATF